MNRIELYLDRSNKLSLDFYYNINDDFPISMFKGEKCYPIISKLCESSILSIKENSKDGEVSLNFKECILNINDYEQILSKRGMGPIKTSLSKYYENEKKKNYKPKKVTRTNKYIGREIIAGVIVLSVFGTILLHEHANKKNVSTESPTISTTVYETEPVDVEKEDFVVKYVGIDKSIPPVEQEVSNEINKAVSVEEEKDVNDDKINICISYEDKSDEEKGKITKAYYGETLNKYAKMYGLDPSIVLAIAIQERGIHSEKKDSGGATGLMQLQNAVWVGKNISAYNYDLNKKETIFVDEESLSDVFFNIKVGCMYFQNCMDYMDNNILAAIQCYNYGYGNMQAVLGAYSFQTGKSKKQILSDVSDNGWMEYRTAIPRKEGDSEYIEHVLRWLGPNIDINNLKIGDNLINLRISSDSEVKVK